MDPIQRSVTFFFPLKTNQKHLFTINLYFYTIWRNQQHVNRKSLYSVAMKQKTTKIVYICIPFICKTHTLKSKWKNTQNKTVNCNEKKPIAVNILYKHTKKTHKTIYPRQQMPTKQATQIRLSSFPFTNTHTYHLFHANVKRVKTNP